MTLEELIEEMKQKMSRYDLSEQCKQAYIGEWTYGVTMIPCEQVLPYLEELKRLRNESIPKEKVRETLKECQNFIDEFENNEKDSIKEYKKLVNDYDMGLKQGVKAEIEMWKKNKMEYVHKRNILMELLGE